MPVAEAKPRQAIDFDIMNPPLIVTNPMLAKGESPNREFPRHVHKYAPTLKDERGAILDTYTCGQYLVVENEEALQAALKDGWSLTPVLSSPKAPDKTK